MRKRILLLSVISVSFVFLSGCVTDSEKKLPDPQQVGVWSIKSISVSGRTISATVVGMATESCWGFVRADHTISGSTITVSIFARRLTNDPCATVMTPIEAPLSITVPTSGTYTLKFWRQQNQSLDTTITIP